jgi:hypothetical protein
MENFWDDDGDNNDDGSDKKIVTSAQHPSRTKAKPKLPQEESQPGCSNYNNCSTATFMYVLPILIHEFCRFLYENQSHSTIIPFISCSYLRRHSPTVAVTISLHVLSAPTGKIIHTIRWLNTLHGLRYRQLSW